MKVAGIQEFSDGGIDAVHFDKKGGVLDPRQSDEFSEEIRNSRDIIVLNVGGEYMTENGNCSEKHNTLRCRHEVPHFEVQLC